MKWWMKLISRAAASPEPTDAEPVAMCLECKVKPRRTGWGHPGFCSMVCWNECQLRSYWSPPVEPDERLSNGEWIQ